MVVDATEMPIVEFPDPPLTDDGLKLIVTPVGCPDAVNPDRRIEPTARRDCNGAAPIAALSRP